MMKTSLLLLFVVSAAALTTFDEAVVAPVERHRRRLQVCDDGSESGANGCCAASACALQGALTASDSACCSGCCLTTLVASSGETTSCTCNGCGDATGTGATVEINSACDGGEGCLPYFSNQGATLLAGISFGGCTQCIGTAGAGFGIICFPTTSARDTCLSQANSLQTSVSLSVTTASDNTDRPNLPATRLACSVSGGSSLGDDDPCFDREVC